MLIGPSFQLTLDPSSLALPIRWRSRSRTSQRTASQRSTKRPYPGGSSTTSTSRRAFRRIEAGRPVQRGAVGASRIGIDRAGHTTALTTVLGSRVLGSKGSGFRNPEPLEPGIRTLDKISTRNVGLGPSDPAPATRGAVATLAANGHLGAMVVGCCVQRLDPARVPGGTAGISRPGATSRRAPGDPS